LGGMVKIVCFLRVVTKSKRAGQNSRMNSLRR